MRDEEGTLDPIDDLRINRLYGAVLQIDELIGVVVHAPPDSWGRPIGKVVRVWPTPEHRVTWGNLPRTPNFLVDLTILESKWFSGFARG
jgi:hypothetical protein